MDVLRRRDLQALMEPRREPCISLYLPTHRAGQEVAQAPIRLKNLARQAEQILVRQGRRAADVRKLLAPLRDLAARESYWREQSQGLAVFLAPGFFGTYRLPLTFQQALVVADRFHVKPLLALFMNDGRFHVLTLRQGGVRLYLATHQGLHRLMLPDVPANIAETERFDHFERESSRRTIGSQREGGRMVYGPGGIQEDDRKQELRLFFRQVDHGLRDVLHAEQLPLVAVGLAYEVAIFREVNTNPRLLEAFVDVHPEHLDEQALYERAWAIMEPYFAAERHRSLDEFAQLNGTGLASTDLPEVLRAAQGGRIRTLIVSLNTHQWGRFDPRDGSVALRPEAGPGDEDLLDVAAAQTFLHDGTVYAVPEIPWEVGDGGATVAAVFRY